ncbi:transglutaminase family protein [Dactylosporangium sp. NPDC005572]|uniref:transglutaminase family protein n=1 Tax=Dactylosporangium sp. NPDC005572 TaxID=3156889 RepID=UPI0033B867F3
MTLTVALEHRTEYRFDRPVVVHPHVVRLRPAPHCRTPITAYSLTIEPAAHYVNWQQDPFGNHVARLVFPERADALSVVVDLVAELTVVNPFDFFLEEYAERFPFMYPPTLAGDLEPYLARPGRDRVEPGSLLHRWVETFQGGGGPGQRMVDLLVELNAKLAADVAYTVRLEPGVQSPEETLKLGIGSCRDSAWLLVAILRRLGLAARFVSGYLVQLTADQQALDGPSGPAQDFTDLHAWTEVYLPGAGWVGLDPTSGLFAGEGHLPLSATPHPSTAAPITGATDPCGVEFSFANTVRRIHQDPRVTRPYDDTTWQRVDRLGREVDAALHRGDVRLTQGGEPTFVSVDDMEAAEWNTAADGPAKRRAAADLAGRLKALWAPGGVTHHGQGKWYPGEPLPRWQSTVYWRTDAEPLWGDPALLAVPHPDGERGGDRGDLPDGADPARGLADAVARRLGLPADVVEPAYEDHRYHAWRRSLEPDGEPGGDDVPAPPDAVALGELPSGWVMPLFRHPDEDRWATSNWRTRRGRLVLTPGSSPLGLRLPLDSVAWTPPPEVADRDPFEPRPPLPARPLGYTGGEPDGPQGPDAPPAAVLPAEGAPRTALAVELRGGLVHVFLPPLTHLEHAVEVLAAVEAAARETGTPVVLEGYPLPGDHRLRAVSVTPDPGVLEVNLPPAASWDELVTLTHQLYSEARLARLGTEKFDLDGTHTGTGGGNHVTLGGATPADSPLLRRADLLRSMLAFWQHHPSLSYVFSGRFIGPTSQAPRVDEARPESLYELQIAFGELDRLAGPDVPERSRPGPWLVDRLFRHLLTDLTGNTHRAEFCIDKLYSPDSTRGRLGLLELRAFEMPPHPQMALVQALLIRALVARFWATPYRADPVRWGTDLHDRFMLPASAAADLTDVLTDLREHGFDFDPSWFDPFLAFRFPRIGEVEVAGVELRLHQALEPWHVLGEEASSGGTARFVDSSVERLQVSATGLVPGRHLVTCNGIPVPLHPVAGAAGQVFGGVRYRAWAPPSALHPTIGIHHPLVVDLIDLWNGRSLGGCTYHVVHPGGRSYERYPVNAAEAEARRARRFLTTGHTPGPVDVAALRALAAGQAVTEYPLTLDLRRHPSATTAAGRGRH